LCFLRGLVGLSKGVVVSVAPPLSPLYLWSPTAISLPAVGIGGDGTSATMLHTKSDAWEGHSPSQKRGNKKKAGRNGSDSLRRRRPMVSYSYCLS